MLHKIVELIVVKYRSFIWNKKASQKCHAFESLVFLMLFWVSGEEHQSRHLLHFRAFDANWVCCKNE